MRPNLIMMLVLLPVFLLTMLTMSFATSDFSDLSELADYSADEEPISEAEGVSQTTKTIVVDEATEMTYTDNHWLQDFEVHFFISLPFTAFFSYLSVMSVDAMVQGKFTPDFHQADIWMIAGFAVGSSIAVALGSVNRVPDQSIYRTQELVPDELGLESREMKSFGKVEVVRICY